MMPPPFFMSYARSLKTSALLCFLLICLGRATAQVIELLPTLEDSTGQYSYFEYPVQYKGKLYMQYRNSANNNVLVGYDGDSYSVYPSPSGFDGGAKGYVGDPIIYKDKLYLRYQDNNSFKYLAVFDGNELAVIDNPVGYEAQNIGGYLGKPIVYQDKLYLQYFSNTFLRTLMAFDGENFHPFDTPAEYVGPNIGYRGTPVLHGDRLYLLFYKKGTVGDLAYVSDSSLVFVPSPAGYDGNSRGYQGNAISFMGKLFAQYENNAGGFDLAAFDQDSLRFWSIPDTLGGAKGLQSTYNAGVLDDQLLLQFQLSGGNFALGTFQDTIFTPIPSPPGFEAMNTGVYGPPLTHQGLAYFSFYDENYARTVVFDGDQLSLIDMPGNDQEASLGEYEEFYLFNNKIYTRYSKDGVSQLAALEGNQAILFDHPNSSEPVSYSGSPIAYNGELYFRYIVNNSFSVLAKLSGVSSTDTPLEVSTDLVLYPNPSHDRHLTIELAKAVDSPVRIQVFDFQGRCLRDDVHQQNGGLSQVQLDLSGLPAGVYVVHTIQAGIGRVVRKVILF